MVTCDRSTLGRGCTAVYLPSHRYTLEARALYVELFDRACIYKKPMASLVAHRSRGMYERSIKELRPENQGFKCRLHPLTRIILEVLIGLPA